MRLWISLLASLVGSVSAADVVSNAIDATELTVYRDTNRGTDELSLNDDRSNGLAMVTETRTIEVPAGASTIQFRGVVDSIVPQTAKLEGIPATIVESNFDYNLLAPGTLIAKSLDRPVMLIRTDRETGEIQERRGILRSGPDGVIVDFGGEIEALNCSGLHERLVLADVPESLTETPTLSMKVRTAKAGKYQVQLSYLALGMDWSADYSARMDADGNRMDISAWITLVNRNGSRLADATTHVVAGTLARQEDETLAPDFDPPALSDRCWPIGDFRQRQRIKKQFDVIESHQMAPSMAISLDSIAVTASRVARASELGDYKLYTLPFSTTVEPRQMKQAQLLDLSNVRIDRLYEYRVTQDILSNDPAPESARSLLRFTNTKDNGLGIPLPAGTWRIMKLTDDGRQYLLGEQALEDTPVDLPRDIYLGASNDVTVLTRPVEEQSAEKESRDTIEVAIANAGATTANVEILHSRQLIENGRIVEESQRHQTKRGDYVWVLRVPPHERTVLRYTVAAPKD
ncbi:MAG TPA: hypothetical protein VGD45_28565 [Steroidobacter sp.]|uniref:DUF4139 domain-containing protein n=1 Tax=Steroidobacter sp. TaxID=1978227 RepID=UPI002ED86A5E